MLTETLTFIPILNVAFWCAVRVIYALSDVSYCRRNNHELVLYIFFQHYVMYDITCPKINPFEMLVVQYIVNNFTPSFGFYCYPRQKQS